MSRLDLTPMAYFALGDNDRDALEARAKSMGVRVQIGRNVRGRYWKVVVSSGSEHVALSGQGPLAAVVAGALDDWEARPDPAFDDDPAPVDLNPEGDPTRNGAFA